MIKKISHILLPFFIFYLEIAKLLSNYLLAFTGGRSKVVVKSVEGSRFRLRQEGENILF